MERFGQTPEPETRLTQSEVAALLNRWRTEQAETVSVEDVAEALHLPKSEVEAMVWRFRAESQPSVRPRIRKNWLRSSMIAVFCSGVLMVLFGSFNQDPYGRNEMTMFGAALLAIWCIYCTIITFADAINGRD